MMTTPATILVVDDDEPIAKLFARMFRLEGYHVRTALTGHAGLQDIEVSRPDGIMLDYRMPDMDGLEFLQRLRTAEQYRTLPVTVATGVHFQDNAIPDVLRELGAEIRQKPLDLRDIADIGRSLASGHK